MSTLLVVTGASRGLGEAIAVEFSKLLCFETLSARNDVTSDGKADDIILRICLVARSSDGLASTTETIRSEVQKLTSVAAVDSILKISQHPMDLSNLETLDKNLDDIITSFGNDGGNWDRSILINNAANLGHLGNLLDMTSLTDMRSYFDFNITSSSWVSQRLLRQFMISNNKKDDTDENTEGGTKRKISVIHISSICAIQGFPTMGVYCTGKAGRDMFHSVLAKEIERATTSNSSPRQHDSEPSIKILNYAPGPLETVMVDELINCTELDEKVHNFFIKSQEENTLIHPYDTAKKLAHLVIKSDIYESGSHVDYYDLKDDEEKPSDVNGK